MKRTVEWMLAVAIVLDIAYWSIWFVDRDVLASSHRSAYYEFENTFPVADLWLGVCCLLALVGLRRQQPMAFFWLVAAGSAGMYLFGMDALYDVQHGIFTSGAGGVVEACIVTITLLFAVTALRFAWTRRRDLLGP